MIGLNAGAFAYSVKGQEEAEMSCWQVVRKLRTMPELVVREMGYRPIESMSSAVFIDFYLNEVISLILVF